MSLKNPLDKSLPKQITGVWASFVSAAMLIVIGVFSITPDSDAAIRFSKITAIFKAVGDLLPLIFILIAISYRQFKLAGIFHIVTLLLVFLVDMCAWAAFVPNAQPIDIMQHIPFAIPIVIAAYCFLKTNSKTNLYAAIY